MDIIGPISILLLSKKTNIKQVNISKGFSWATTRDITLELQLFSGGKSSLSVPYGSNALVTVSIDPKGDSSFSQVLLKMVTDSSGRLNVSITIPAALSELQVTVFDASKNQPTEIISLGTSSTINVAITMNNLETEETAGDDQALYLIKEQ